MRQALLHFAGARCRVDERSFPASANDHKPCMLLLRMKSLSLDHYTVYDQTDGM